MIISKKKYKAMAEVIVRQRECIRLLEEQNCLLAKIIKKTTNYDIKPISDLDFPNSHKSCENKLF